MKLDVPPPNCSQTIKQRTLVRGLSKDLRAPHGRLLPRIIHCPPHDANALRGWGKLPGILRRHAVCKDLVQRRPLILLVQARAVRKNGIAAGLSVFAFVDLRRGSLLEDALDAARLTRDLDCKPEA